MSYYEYQVVHYFSVIDYIQQQNVHWNKKYDLFFISKGLYILVGDARTSLLQ